jgi:hypothetical protein
VTGIKTNSSNNLCGSETEAAGQAGPGLNMKTYSGVYRLESQSGHWLCSGLYSFLRLSTRILRFCLIVGQYYFLPNLFDRHHAFEPIRRILMSTASLPQTRNQYENTWVIPVNYELNMQ